MIQTDPSLEIIAYGQALVKILQGFETLKPKAAWFERLLIKLLQTTYRQRLREIVKMAPEDVTNQIFTALNQSERL